ncbi:MULTISPECIES: hypothetical protein [Achromobacter]|uniref:Lipoprotein n=2 Tax=Achromobacter piechaudii TaxID=72556 RepID=A0ABM8KZL9_9BURK|nr:MULTISPECIES: hypothetical protein [Achromobacter]EFF76788.1 hypothetical protein HMPREF0004_1876 [Achromobacter piechaudii ATCC 43553]MPS78842.1 hypothetical protein [Achromobacter sp.]CAB3715635.1 hypothetical protein LMG1873_03484 [Achromobacter piechaudii]CAB3882710.1 hypothetical protein LMG2828_03568 [Achromobacter piechaudii]CAB3952501.1 hypothetical protein LMG6103_03456 [Achromobacter piechaudii]
MQRKWLAVAAVVAVAGLAGCDKKSEYPEGIRLVTYSSCVEGFKKSAGARPDVDARSAAYCRCVLDGLQKSVPLKDYTAYDRMLVVNEKSAERDRIEPMVNAVVNMCVQEQLQK